MTRSAISILFFLVLSLGVGFLVSGDDELVDWAIAGGLFGLALAGEGVRVWLRRGRKLKKGTTQSSGI